MSIVVEQTLPFNSQTLDLQNPTRWTSLFPLVRPAVKQIQTAKDHTILVDETLAKGNHVRVAAIGSSGNFSSEILDSKGVSAVVTGTAGGAGVLTASDVQHELKTKYGEQSGIVVVKAGTKAQVDVHGSDFVEVETQGELQQDHVLHLLCHARESCRASIHQTADMLKAFVGAVSTARETFHTEKANGAPAVLDAEGAVSGYQKAREVVERDLKKVMRGLEGKGGADVVYSVHYSDVNGLSRLENYILAKEIAEYLGKRLRTKTIGSSLLTSPQTPKNSPTPSRTRQSSTTPTSPAASPSPSAPSNPPTSPRNPNLNPPHPSPPPTPPPHNPTSPPPTPK